MPFTTIASSTESCHSRFFRSSVSVQLCFFSLFFSPFFSVCQQQHQQRPSAAAASSSSPLRDITLCATFLRFPSLFFFILFLYFLPLSFFLFPFFPLATFSPPLPSRSIVSLQFVTLYLSYLSISSFILSLFFLLLLVFALNLLPPLFYFILFFPFSPFPFYLFFHCFGATATGRQSAVSFPFSVCLMQQQQQHYSLYSGNFPMSVPAKMADDGDYQKTSSFSKRS